MGVRWKQGGTELIEVDMVAELESVKGKGFYLYFFFQAEDGIRELHS